MQTVVELAELHRSAERLPLSKDDLLWTIHCCVVWIDEHAPYVHLRIVCDYLRTHGYRRPMQGTFLGCLPSMHVYMPSAHST